MSEKIEYITKRSPANKTITVFKISDGPMHQVLVGVVGLDTKTRAIRKQFEIADEAYLNGVCYLNHEEMMEALRKKHKKNGWFKDGGEFDAVHAGSIWSGEESHDNDHNKLFEPYAIDLYLNNEAYYIMEIQKELHEFSEARGWYWESYDCGTYFAYKF